jgi:hypothetical protein
MPFEKRPLWRCGFSHMMAMKGSSGSNIVFAAAKVILPLLRFEPPPTTPPDAGNAIRVGKPSMNRRGSRSLIAALDLMDRQADQRACDGFGFRRGTDAYSNCMMQQAAQREEEGQRARDREAFERARHERERRTRQSRPTLPGYQVLGFAH